MPPPPPPPPTHTHKLSQQACLLLLDQTSMSLGAV